MTAPRFMLRFRLACLQTLSARVHHVTRSLLFPLLLLTAAGLLGWLGSRYSLAWDWSAGGRNSLSQTSQQLLHRLEGPLTLTAYVRGNEKRLRQLIREFVARYQRVKPDIELIFIDPELVPEQAGRLRAGGSFELELAYAGKRERLKRLSEQTLSNAIQRLSQHREHWILTLEGHGERNVLGTANRDLGRFGQELKRSGLHVQPLDLTRIPRIPDNTAVLLIAGPATALLPGETKRILTYLEDGGNLLWLLDQGDPAVLAGLADHLGLRRLPGVIVDADVSTLGLDDPGFALVSRYPHHRLTRDLKAFSLFPRAIALEIPDPGTWQVTPILSTLERSWNETGPIQGEIELNPASDEHRGPLHIGLALTRSLPKESTDPGREEQRVVIIGDGDFLSNGYLGNGGNLALGLNVLRWLSEEDDLLHIPIPSAPDRTLNLSRRASAVIGLGFLLVLPLTLLGTGLYLRWRRRRL